MKVSKWAIVLRNGIGSIEKFFFYSVPPLKAQLLQMLCKGSDPNLFNTFPFFFDVHAICLAES